MFHSYKCSFCALFSLIGNAFTWFKKVKAQKGKQRKPPSHTCGPGTSCLLCPVPLPIIYLGNYFNQYIKNSHNLFGCIVFQQVDVPQFTYSSYCWRNFRLFHSDSITNNTEVNNIICQLFCTFPCISRQNIWSWYLKVKLYLHNSICYYISSIAQCVSNVFAFCLFS